MFGLRLLAAQRHRRRRTRRRANGVDGLFLAHSTWRCCPSPAQVLRVAYPVRSPRRLPPHVHDIPFLFCLSSIQLALRPSSRIHCECIACARHPQFPNATPRPTMPSARRLRSFFLATFRRYGGISKAEAKHLFMWPNYYHIGIGSHVIVCI